MLPSITIDHLVNAARNVGIDLTPTDDDSSDAHLYAWCTPQREVTYIGKSESPHRVSNETTWRDTYNADDYDIGLSLLLQGATAHRLTLDINAFNPQRLLDITENYEGESIDSLRDTVTNGYTPDTRECEKILIRIAIHTGAVIANSQHASEWEGQYGRTHDVIGYLAARNTPPPATTESAGPTAA